MEDSRIVELYWQKNTDAITETGNAGHRLLPAEDYPYALFTEIIWEENRAIACVGTMKNGQSADIQQETRFLFTDFDGLDVSFQENGLTADYLAAGITNHRAGKWGRNSGKGAFLTGGPLG